jgi:transaldolase
MQLNGLGQSVWLDYLRRRFVAQELGRLVDDDGLRGVTSNPTIFEHAIGGSGDYDERLRQLAREQPGADPAAVYEIITTEDVRAACDVLRSVYEKTEGRDGFVSIEVSPGLARDTRGSIAEAQRLWHRIDRPNVMVKIPATREGIPAIEALIAAGINVNITLMFSLDHYDAVAHAYLRGLARCPDPRRVASVASFFVSRVDTLVDARLDRVGTPAALALRGRIAVANAKAAYARYHELFHGAPFAALRRRGARPQRPLWASTGTKDPAYSDVLYVEELIGPETINTMPPSTLAAFRDHGRVRETLTADLDRARADLAAAARLGVDVVAVGAELQAEGVAAFARSLEQALAAVAEKQRRVAAAPVDQQSLRVRRS